MPTTNGKNDTSNVTQRPDAPAGNRLGERIEEPKTRKDDTLNTDDKQAKQGAQKQGDQKQGAQKQMGAEATKTASPAKGDTRADGATKTPEKGRDEPTRETRR